MSLPRLDHATHIADQLNNLAAVVKTRSRASLTDANRILETISARFFNALFGWHLVNLNTEQTNYPAADLGDCENRIAIQVTNEASSDKIKRTADKAIAHELNRDFDRLIVFFLLPKKPGFPKKLTQPPRGPAIETWDIPDLLKQMQEMCDLKLLAQAAKVLDEELGRTSERAAEPKYDINRILKYAPVELIGREDELKLLSDTWAKIQTQAPKRTRILTFVAFGGEGKTSLVAKWAVELAAQNWPGCDAAFAWSFYSQGTREQIAASSDLFLKEALNFFGVDADKQFAASNAGAFEKGQRLARIVGQRRNLLILDGLEPLQYSPASPTPGELKDQGVAALLKGLAANGCGLCLVTSRYSLPDLRAYWQTTAPEKPLLCLSTPAGVDLLKNLGVTGTAHEFATLVEDVKGHALTLTLLGGFLKRAYHGDIHKRDRVKFEKADEKMDGGHAFRTMAAYEQWLLRNGGDEGRREVAVLRLMGLFDRPADAGCLAALRSEAIPGLTEPLTGLADDDWEYCLTGLEAAKLLTVNRDAARALVSLDAHPHLRAYFAKQLSENNPEVWRAGHRRLYEHLCTTTPDKPQPTLEDLQPLYQAVAHGCQAGLELQQESFEKVFCKRIQRNGKKQEYYSTRRIGAYGSDLSAIACFFDSPWNSPSKSFSEYDCGKVLFQAGFGLRASGRLTEAVGPMRESLSIALKQDGGKKAVITRALNLSELDLLLGDLSDALHNAKLSVSYADDGESEPLRSETRARVANALEAAGQTGDAEAWFLDAEKIRPFANFDSDTRFEYCNFLLAAPERAAWQMTLGITPQNPELESTVGTCRSISSRTTEALEVNNDSNQSLLGKALDHLTLGRTALYEAILKNFDFQLPASNFPDIEQAMTGIRNAGTQHYLPCGLLARAWLRFLAGACTGHESAQSDLDEAWDIAVRGPMKLRMVDVQLYRARLFRLLSREKKYPWNSPEADLAAAEEMINKCGYHRRDEELTDAKRALFRK